VPDGPVDGPQPRRAQRHRLDRPLRRAVEIDDVADAELVLGEDEQPGQEVLDDCEPKPSATPSTPAPASSGATSTPSSLSTMKPAKMRIVKPARLRRTLVSALMRCCARRLVAGASSSAAGVRRRTALSRSRTIPELTLRRPRLIERPTTLLRIRAPTRIRTIVSGVPKMKSATSASVLFSVRWRISRHR